MPRRSKTFRLLAPIAATAGVLVSWHLGVAWSGISPVILPAPGAVASELVTNLGEIAGHCLLTLLEALGGFLLATLLGILAAILFVLVPSLSDALYPLVVAVKMIPLIALAPLIVVWFGTGIFSKIVMAAIVAFFPILVNALRGLRDVGSDYHDVFASLSATQWQVLWKLRFPSAIGYTFAALRVAAVFAVIGAVVAEFIGASAGIGFYVKSASYYAATDRMIAGIVATAAVGAVLYGGVLLLERSSPRWRWASGGGGPI